MPASILWMVPTVVKPVWGRGCVWLASLPLAPCVCVCAASAPELKETSCVCVASLAVVGLVCAWLEPALVVGLP